MIGEGGSGGGNEKFVCSGVEEGAKRGLKVVLAGDVAVKKVGDGGIDESVQGIIVGGRKDKVCSERGAEDTANSYPIRYVVIVREVWRI